MAQMIEIKALARVKDRLASRSRIMAQRLTVGLKRAGLFLQRASQKIVPVDIGNLYNSAFTVSRYDGTFAVEVRVGYTASYALYVHENLDALHGAAFNAAYADQIGRAKSRRAKRKKEKRTVVHDPFGHTRGENQQAKFLERPLRELKGEMRDILVDAMQ